MPAEVPSLPAEDHIYVSCGLQYMAISVAQATEAIRINPDEVRDAALRVPEEVLRQRPDEATWSVLEYVCHLRDVYATYTIRLYRTRREDSPALEPMFNDLRALRFRYDRRDLPSVLGELADNTAGFCDEVAAMPPEGWGRPATRLPGEERTARWLVRQVMHEGLHHLADIASVARWLTDEHL